MILELLEEIKEFQKNVPLIRCLCNPGLKSRHWEEITKIVNVPISADKDMQLRRLLSDTEIMKFLPQIEDISDNASKEFGIEKILNKMMDDWSKVLAELKTWKDTGTYIVSGGSIDEIQQILDDQIVKTLTMKGSPYAKIFEQRIKDWEDWLNFTLSFTEMWVKV